MGRRTKQKPFRRVHTRKIDRMVAKCNMIRSGVSIHDMIKHHAFTYRWREFANMNIGG